MTDTIERELAEGPLALLPKQCCQPIGEGCYYILRPEEKDAIVPFVAAWVREREQTWRDAQGETEADLATVIAERDSLRAELDDYKRDHAQVMAERCASDEKHCSCVPHLRAEVEKLRAVASLTRLLRLFGADCDNEGIRQTLPKIDDALAALEATKETK